VTASVIDMSSAATAPQAAFRTWMCVVCGFIYNEADGLPEEGIAPGTRWHDVPDTWTCPDCGVTKDDFEMVEVG
jgi:rubredoxin